jgi:hypothetical protein
LSKYTCSDIPQKPYTLSSDKPMFEVLLLTVFTVNLNEFVTTGVKLMTTAPPVLFNEPTFTVEPLLKVSVALVIWSLVFGRSYTTT